MSKQYSNLYFDEVEEVGFVEAGVLSLLEDRMKSSVNNGDEFTDKRGTFIVYTIKDLMKFTKFGKRRITNIFKTLKEKGYVETYRPFSRANRIYLPKFHYEPSKSSKMNLAKVSKCTPNQSTYNQLNKSEIYTVNTDAVASTSHTNKIDVWKQAVIGKIGLTESAVNAILKFTNNDLKRAYKLVKVITNARTSVVRENGLKRSNKTDFKTNLNIKDKLATKLQYLFNYLPKDLIGQAKYLTKALKTFFSEALGIKQDYTRPQSPNAKDGKINRKAPKWMDQKYDPNANPLKESTRKRFEAQLAALKAMKPVQ